MEYEHLFIYLWHVKCSLLCSLYRQLDKMHIKQAKVGIDTCTDHFKKDESVPFIALKRLKSFLYTCASLSDDSRSFHVKAAGRRRSVRSRLQALNSPLSKCIFARFTPLSFHSSLELAIFIGALAVSSFPPTPTEPEFQCSLTPGWTPARVRFGGKTVLTFIRTLPSRPCTCLPRSHQYTEHPFPATPVARSEPCLCSKEAIKQSGPAFVASTCKVVVDFMMENPFNPAVLTTQSDFTRNGRFSLVSVMEIKLHRGKKKKSQDSDHKVHSLLSEIYSLLSELKVSENLSLCTMGSISHFL